MDAAIKVENLSKRYQIGKQLKKNLNFQEQLADLGMTRVEINKKFDEIVEFSDLSPKRFINRRQVYATTI